jgi:hypothetical protein
MSRHRKTQPEKARASAMATCVTAAAVTYGAALLTRGFGPDIADLQVGLTVGPVVLLLTICIGTQVMRIASVRAAIQVPAPVGAVTHRAHAATRRASPDYAGSLDAPTEVMARRLGGRRRRSGRMRRSRSTSNAAPARSAGQPRSAGRHAAVEVS